MTGTELLEKRERCGLTQDQLARYFRVSRTSIWRRETGKVPILRTNEIQAKTLSTDNKELYSWIMSLPKEERKSIWRRQRNFSRES